jgi:hypothetical protein
MLASATHWLGEGALGQESLFDDLNPFLFAVDRHLCQFVKKVCREYSGPRVRPNAVLIPPYPQVPWHIAHLSNYFNVVVWSDVGDFVSEAAIEQFGAERYSGSVVCLPLDGVDLVLQTDPALDNKVEFWTSIRESYEMLSEGGSVAAVLQVENHDGEWVIPWSDGTYDSLVEVQQNPYCNLFNPGSLVVESLKSGAGVDVFAVSQFLERHQAFFGKKCREFCLSRMREADFVDLVNCRNPLLGSALLVWHVE